MQLIRIRNPVAAVARNLGFNKPEDPLPIFRTRDVAIPEESNGIGFLKDLRRRLAVCEMICAYFEKAKPRSHSTFLDRVFIRLISEFGNAPHAFRILKSNKILRHEDRTRLASILEEKGAYTYARELLRTKCFYGQSEEKLFNCMFGQHPKMDRFELGQILFPG